MTLPAGYFEQMYSESADPWGFRTRWYEQRKRALTAAVLPQRRYARGFEPGCSIGSLTAVLADRCDSLLAVDASERAVAAAAAALSGHPQVEVRGMRVPEEWPDGGFDLVVLSEVGYYLAGDDLDRLTDCAERSLVDGGTLLACHWRHPVDDYPVTGDEVHAVLGGRPGLDRVVTHIEEDLLLDVWTKGRVPSVAHREGLVG